MYQAYLKLYTKFCYNIMMSRIVTHELTRDVTCEAEPEVNIWWQTQVSDQVIAMESPWTTHTSSGDFMQHRPCWSPITMCGSISPWITHTPSGDFMQHRPCWSPITMCGSISPRTTHTPSGDFMQHRPCWSPITMCGSISPRTTHIKTNLVIQLLYSVHRNKYC